MNNPSLENIAIIFPLHLNTDITKAFDTIDHEIILRKMSFLGVDQAAIKWFSSYLSDRTQRCSVNGKLSTARTLGCGVPQGSILGPLIYINDLPNSLHNAVPTMFAGIKIRNHLSAILREFY